MPKLSKAQITSVKHRAICNDCSFKGDKRDDPQEALQDALKHRSKPGKENHILYIDTEQSSRREIR